MTGPPPNYNGIARAYRWLEYLTLGPLLQRTRTAHLARLQSSQQALILGDGDGRFTAALLATNPAIHIQAVDASAVMLHLLQTRCAPFNPRLTITQTDIRDPTHYIPGAPSQTAPSFEVGSNAQPPTSTPDLVVTHFVLDCLTQPEVDSLIAQLTPHLTPKALWLVSDFSIPAGPMHWPARIYVRLLYLAFRILTGMTPTRLPNHALPLTRSGFTLIAERRLLFGILISQLWQRQ
jgi:hypothetical protein